jgi:hypothetical protein
MDEFIVLYEASYTRAFERVQAATPEEAIAAAVTKNPLWMKRGTGTLWIVRAPHLTKAAVEASMTATLLLEQPAPLVDELQ